MSTAQDEWRAGRIFHLSGGVRAINVEGPKIVFEPHTVAGKICQAQGKSYASTYGDLRKMGFQVLGVDFYSHLWEVEGKTPPDWRVYEKGWESWQQGQAWSQLANSGFQTKNGYLWDLAGRISQQMRICSWRVRQASEAYAEQLSACSKLGQVEAGKRFEDGFTKLAYIAVQSYLVDACILRDYLAEFLAGFVWPPAAESTRPQTTTFSGLLKKVISSVARPDPFADQIDAAGKPGGWLEVLGHYRDLVVHTAPLATAGTRLFALIEHRPLPEGQAMPVLRLPLPTNPGELRAQRATRALFSDFQAQLDAFVQSAAGKVPSIDGLDYIWETQGRLANFAAAVIGRSPVKGEMMKFDESNIIGDIRFMT